MSAARRASIPRRLGVYGCACVAAVLAYAGLELSGWGIQPDERAQLPPDARRSPGGYRSHHFWHTGLRGGK